MSSSSNLHRQTPGSATQTSRFFDLPAEVCHEIYFLAFGIPTTKVTLHAHSTGTRAQTKRDGSRQRIQFEYFVDSPSGLEVRQIRMSRYRICRQIYTEIMNLWFERATWAFGNASMLLDALEVIPISVQSKIRSLAIWVEPGRSTCRVPDGSREVSTQHTACSIQELNAAALRLRFFQQLRVLQIYIALATFRRRKNPDRPRKDMYSIKNDQPHYDFSANEAIGLFVWDDLETRISVAEADLRTLNAEGLWTDLEYCFGPSNVQWAPRDKDRYRGVLGDIVIKGEVRKIAGPSTEPLLSGLPPLSESKNLPRGRGLRLNSNRYRSPLHHVGVRSAQGRNAHAVRTTWSVLPRPLPAYLDAAEEPRV